MGKARTNRAFRQGITGSASGGEAPQDRKTHEGSSLLYNPPACVFIAE